jgi:hypothetical protein
MKTVIFLDFDGVLHPYPCTYQELFEGIALLAPVLHNFQDQTEIVISSSWREHHTLDELRVHFPVGIRPMLVGMTPVLQEPHAAGVYYERQREIEAWLRLHRPVGTPWLAIDDWAAGFAPKCPDLLLTQYRFGIQKHNLRTLEMMLRIRSFEL